VNGLIKFIVFIWLLTCAIGVWIGMAMVGLFFAFTNWSILYSITPYIGLTAAICIIKCAMYVLLKSNPVAYIEDKSNKVKAWFK
jgi:hypothetical protein